MRTHLVERVATRDRLALVSLAVIEAARRYVAAQLRAERKACGVKDGGDFDSYQEAVNVSLDALQDLRDCLAAHSRHRVRR